MSFRTVLFQIGKIVVKNRTGDEKHGQNLQDEPNGQSPFQKVVDQDNEVADDDQGRRKKREIQKPLPDAKISLGWIRFVVLIQEPADEKVNRKENQKRRQRPTNRAVIGKA